MFRCFDNSGIGSAAFGGMINFFCKNKERSQDFELVYKMVAIKLSVLKIGPKE